MYSLNANQNNLLSRRVELNVNINFIEEFLRFLKLQAVVGVLVRLSM